MLLNSFLLLFFGVVILFFHFNFYFYYCLISKRNKEKTRNELFTLNINKNSRQISASTVCACVCVLTKATYQRPVTFYLYRRLVGIGQQLGAVNAGVDATAQPHRTFRRRPTTTNGSLMCFLLQMRAGETRIGCSQAVPFGRLGVNAPCNINPISSELAEPVA